ncbi:MAG: 50S ribosomal protein L23 [Candidatus Moranbacteria bacterium]|nr:50S ribosomal protein L23 [Candidatus Moranbacteria bacterium]
MTAMFGSKKEEEKKSLVKKTADKTVEKKAKKVAKKKVKKISEDLIKKADLVNSVIIAPIVSEDAMNKTTFGKYVFKVNPRSNKNQIAEAVEVLYGVEVTKVNVMKYKQKNHRFRTTKGQKSGYKKAVVTLKSGQEIQLFSE